jgi:hypothetical protein
VGIGDKLMEWNEVVWPLRDGVRVDRRQV